MHYFLTYCGLLATNHTRSMLGFVADVFSDEEVVEAGILAGILRNNVAGNKFVSRSENLFHSKKLRSNFSLCAVRESRDEEK